MPRIVKTVQDPNNPDCTYFLIDTDFELYITIAYLEEMRWEMNYSTYATMYGPIHINPMFNGKLVFRTVELITVPEDMKAAYEEAKANKQKQLEPPTLRIEHGKDNT